MKHLTLHTPLRTLLLFLLSAVTSCIEPPLHLPAEEVLVDMPIVVTELKLVWNVDVDWNAQWHYGWDDVDEDLFGALEYPTPTNFEVRRYFLGDKPSMPHLEANREPGFTIYDYSFSSVYQFGYYDMLIWSNIDSKDHTQVVTINEEDINEVTASTTITRSARLNTRGDDDRPTALYNQPEVFYSAYPRDIHISHDYDDYDYYDEDKHMWVKHINTTLEPIVYIYLVQIVIYNNEDGRVRSINGDCAISALASGTSVNTGHTMDSPCNVYFNTRMKRNLEVNGRRADIIGGKLTTYGLSDMDGYASDTRAQYSGSRKELNNYLYYELNMSGGTVQTLRADVTEQLQSQCHGGIITIEIDARDIDNPTTGGGSGSIFNPTVEDYEELIYDIPM